MKQNTTEKAFSNLLYKTPLALCGTLILPNGLCKRNVPYVWQGFNKSILVFQQTLLAFPESNPNLNQISVVAVQWNIMENNEDMPGYNS